jgi:polyhydroxyalkanoate synthesis regulator phasin
MTAKLDCTAADEARRIVNELIRIESRGAGDTENAMKRLGNRYGLPWRVFWNVRYRTPKDVFAGVLQRLREAHAEETRRQITRMAHDLEMARASGVHVDDLQDQVAALAAELEGCLAQRRDGEN